MSESPSNLSRVLTRADAKLRRAARFVPGAKRVLTLSQHFWQAGAAHLRRPSRRDVTYVGVTGSCGKTTTTQLIGAVLSSAGAATVSSGGNGYRAIAKSLLRIEKGTRFFVAEVSGSRPGRMKPQLRLLWPSIGVVTTIGTDHYKSFRSKEATAAEKGKLIEWLPAHGTAILNADDPHVLAMRSRTRARVLTVGCAAEAELRAIEVASNWPDRLSLTVVHAGESVRLNTQLVGEWWVTSVLAAIACGLANGLDLKTCASRIENFQPTVGRWSVHPVPGAATYIFDHKAPIWTIEASIGFMAAASARRKTIIFGTISDYPGSSAPKYRSIARQALAASDRVIFVGPHAGHVSKLARDSLRERLLSFDTPNQASKFLKERTLPGELILLKGSISADHLERIMLAQLDDVVCWRDGCGRVNFCRDCNRYRQPSPPKPYSVNFLIDQ